MNLWMKILILLVVVAIELCMGAIAIRRVSLGGNPSSRVVVAAMIGMSTFFTVAVVGWVLFRMLD